MTSDADLGKKNTIVPELILKMYKALFIHKIIGNTGSRK